MLLNFDWFHLFVRVAITFIIAKGEVRGRARCSMSNPKIKEDRRNRSTSHFSLKDLAVADESGASREKTVEMVKGANFFSFIMDGSTDISGTEQETVYIRYANKGKVHEQFLSIGSPTSTGSNDLFVFINELFDKLGIPKDKLVGMGSDGASNMTGCKTGLATQLKREHHDFVNIHCLCHRLELAFRDVVKSQKLYDKLMTLLIGLHYFYKKSHKNKTGLLRAFKALDIKGVLPPKVTGTRWLPHLSNGLECLERSFAGFEAHLATASHSNAKAEGLFKLLLDYNVVAYALFLKELLTPLMQLSKKLQKRDITLADSLTWIETTAEMIEDLKTREMPKLQDVLESGKLNTISLKGQTPKMAYKDGVIDQVFSAIHKRFQLDDSSESVAKATRILSFKNWPSDKNLADYGNKEMEFLAKTYHDRLVATDTEYSPENVTPEWDRLKRLGKRLITLSETTPTWEEVYDEDCKSAMLIIDLLLSLPPTSVSCETAFSQMKLLKTGRRVKLSQCTLDNLMQVKLATPEVGSYDPEESIDHCLTASCKPRGRRRLYYKRNVASSAGEAAVSVCLPEETPTSENANDEDEPVTNNTADASESEEEDEMEDEVVLNKLNPDDGDSDYCSDFQDEDFNYKKLLNYAREC